MTSFFCLFCGIKTEGNVELWDKKSSAGTVNCPCCLLSVHFDIVKGPERNLDEADAIFQATELTSSQKGSKRKILPK